MIKKMNTSPDHRILKALRASAVHLPAGDLAGQTGLAPGVVATRIPELRAAGYTIDEQPHLGYRMLAAPDRLIADDLSGMLEDCKLVREILVFEETDSTNNVVTQLGRNSAGEGLVVFAETQKAGRGRLGRKWESASRKGLWFSLLMRPRFPMQTWTRLTTWAAVGAATGIEEVTGCRTAIKWPNDIYIEGKKVVGILSESHAGREAFAVVGIGVNVNQTDFPEPISKTATSLALAAGHPLDRQEVAAAILRGLDHWSRKLEDGFSEIVAAAEERSYLRGRRVELLFGDRTLTGIAGSLDENGALLVITPDGAQVSVASGEVTVAAHRL